MRNKMKPYFQTLKGGLFESVNKADVGDNADKMKEDDVAMLCWADPFFPDDKLDYDVRAAIEKSLLDGTAQHYTAPIGNAELKETIAKKLFEDNYLSVNSKRNIIITPGSDAALFFSLVPFIEPGDEVMIVDPSYPNNFQAVQILGGIPVSVPVMPETGFEIEIEEFEKRLTDRTKMVILSNPNNPTTVVYSRKSMEALADFVKKNDLIIVVDQAFEDIVFDEKEMITMASLEGMFERTITIFSISKGFGLSGLRVGYIVAPDVLIDTMFASAVSVIGASNTASQLAAITALQKRKALLRGYKETFDYRRKVLYDALRDIPGVEMQIPQSAFLSWIDVSKLGSSDEIVNYLIEEAKVFVNSGNCYGSMGEGYIRLVQGCYRDDETIEAIIRRIRAALIKKSHEKGLR
ncbi:pyridoxal phosphate-dependent aminotransferase [Emergencia sp.]|uniref:pyridoxal phosphate-dependent aminotransferase n=1 Tax=Emergencia sp. TaxID=1926557 RepID=UPI003AF02974